MTRASISLSGPWLLPCRRLLLMFLVFPGPPSSPRLLGRFLLCVPSACVHVSISKWSSSIIISTSTVHCLIAVEEDRALKGEGKLKARERPRSSGKEQVAGADSGGPGGGCPLKVTGYRAGVVLLSTSTASSYCTVALSELKTTQYGASHTGKHFKRREIRNSRGCGVTEAATKRFFSSGI